MCGQRKQEKNNNNDDTIEVGTSVWTSEFSFISESMCYEVNHARLISLNSPF